MKPWIGITPTLNPTEKQCQLWDAYIKGVVRAGGIPLILPCTEDPALVQRYVELVDGLLISGGHDIEPRQYGEESLDGFEIEWPMTPERDLFEIALIRSAVQLDKPMLGICRGHQILNVAFGGSLFQDIDLLYPREPRLRHFQSSPWPDPCHHVNLAPDSKLAAIMNDTVLQVNSLHHQAVKEPGEGIVITGRSRDGVAESLERPQNRFVVGVQWHPELMASANENWLRLFSALVTAASHP